MKKFISALIVSACLLMLTSCSGGRVKNTVFTPEDLPNKRVGILNDTTTIHYLSDFEDDGMIVTPYWDSDEMLDDVTGGRLDCAVIDGAKSEGALTGHSRLKLLEEPARDDGYSIVTARESSSMMKLIDNALGELIADGTIQSIIDSYIQGTDYKYQSSDDGEHDRSLTLALNYIGRPFAYTDENGQAAGIDIDVARAVCDKIDAGLVIRDGKGDDLIYMVRSGRADFALGRLTKTEENEELAAFSQPYYTCRQVIIVRK